MSRVVATLLARIAAVVGQPLSASTALAATPDSGRVYVYDGQHHSTATGYTTTERGPPTYRDTTTPTFDAVDFLLRGASACPEPSTTLSWTTYDDPSGFVPVARAAGTTTERDQPLGGELCPVERSDVAAKTVSEVKPNATVRDLLDVAGNAREPLKSGLASRRSDSELLDSVLRPRDGTYMTVSRDGALLEGNHRRFELLDRVANPRSSIDWDTPIFLDGWPW